MIRRLTLLAAGFALMAGMAATRAAEAGHRDWFFGAGFRVGGFDFQIGFHQPVAPRPLYGPGLFFYTTRPLRYGGYGCHDACFRGGGGYFHHAACPLVGHHFHRHGYSAGFYLQGFAPWGPFYDRGYRGHHHRHPSRSHGYYLYRDGGHRSWGHRDRGVYRYWGDRHRHDHRRHDRYRDDRRHRDDREYRDDRGRRDYRDRRDGRRDRGRDRARPRYRD